MRERAAGGLISGLGILVLWMVSSEPGALQGPLWVGWATGGVFVAAGVVMATRRTPVAAWTEAVGTGAILVAFAAVGGWVALGPGPRACSGGIDLPFVSLAWGSGETGCRVAFGFGAVMVVSVLLLFLGTGAAKRFPDSRWAGAGRSAGEWGVILALSPLLVLLLTWSVVVGLAHAARARWTRPG